MEEQTMSLLSNSKQNKTDLKLHNISIVLRVFIDLTYYETIKYCYF